MTNKKFWFYFFRLIGYDMRQRRFLPELTTNFLQNSFNKKVLDQKNVQYFSVVGTGDPWQGTLSALIWFPYVMLKGDPHPTSKEANDGLVPASSQRWGKVLTELPLDHLAQMNHYPFRWERSAESLAMSLKSF